MCERTDRIAWAVRRARASLQHGDFVRAGLELVADLEEHPATRGHPAVQQMIPRVHCGGFSTSRQVQEFIDAIA